MSDYTPPAVVTPTPGGAVGDGNMDGAITLIADVAPANYANNTSLLKIGSSGNVLAELQGSGATASLSLQAPNGNGYITMGNGVVSVPTLSVSGIGSVDGVSPIRGAALRIALTTVAGTVATFTPSAVGSLRVVWRLAAKAATTPTLTLTYTDPDAGAQTITLYNTAMAANGVASGVYPLVSGASAIAVSGSALVAGDIIATVEIIQSQ